MESSKQPKYLLKETQAEKTYALPTPTGVLHPAENHIYDKVTDTMRAVEDILKNTVTKLADCDILSASCDQHLWHVQQMKERIEQKYLGKELPKRIKDLQGYLSICQK